MIEVEKLTRRFGAHTAIEDVSFKVERGEVVGFLGPNGAGKTTTMRILSGCIGATQGRALIDGMDVLEKPREVKSRVGYLPEVPPLYGNMSVGDFVAFAARIKGVDDAEAAATRAMEQVGLLDVRERIIDHLSKGYRQRVGLAQALVHDPDVLILDEPTSGLDPAQRREIRELLRALAEGERTVILSTHVLGEVEAVCERVIIINEGHIVARDRIDALAARSGAIRLRVARPGDDLPGVLRSVPGVREVEAQPDGSWLVHAEDDVREQVARAVVDRGLLELAINQQLEDIYLRLTRGGEA